LVILALLLKSEILSYYKLIFALCKRIFFIYKIFLYLKAALEAGSQFYLGSVPLMKHSCRLPSLPSRASRPVLGLIKAKTMSEGGVKSWTGIPATDRCMNSVQIGAAACPPEPPEPSERS
jgi:hypothetical protein